METGTGTAQTRARQATREVRQPHHSLGHNRLDADVGHHGVRSICLSLFAHFEALNRRIPTLPQCQIDPLQHDVVDFEALLERDLA